MTKRGTRKKEQRFEKMSHSLLSLVKFPIDAGSDPPPVSRHNRCLIHSQYAISVVKDQDVNNTVRRT